MNFPDFPIFGPNHSSGRSHAIAQKFNLNARGRICGNLNAMKALLFSFIAISGLSLNCARAQTQTAGVLMAGTRYQTPFYVHSGADPGPTVVVIGGVHGDETAGYLAARALVNWKVQSGTLVIVPDANVPAIRANQRFVGRNMNAFFPRQSRWRWQRASGFCALAISEEF